MGQGGGALENREREVLLLYWLARLKKFSICFMSEFNVLVVGNILLKITVKHCIDNVKTII